MRRATAGLALVVVLLAGAAGCGRVGGEPFQPTLNTPITLEAGEVVGQTVNPADDRVSGLAVVVATFAADPDPTGELEVALRDPASGEVLASAAVPGDVLVDGGWAEARFEPAVEVGDVVLAEVGWQGGSPLALWANTPLEGTDGITNDPYAGGELVAGGSVAGGSIEGDLAFRVISPSGPGEVVDQVVEVARSTGARLADEPVFAVLWLLAAAGGLTLAAWGLRRRDPRI
ncbi:hypothetical protein [Euzebya sp.]|uniref:hypothetical protein n=1 Tax=Euzebya sp. TaxID=1971409 RepID=UPI0035127E2C